MVNEVGGLPTFDIEAINWVAPIAVGFYDGYNYIEFLKEEEDDDIIWRFLCYLKENYRSSSIYAHCASKFDSKFILASLCKHGEIAGLEAGLLKLKWREPNITFEDSYFILPMSLSKANKLFGVEEKKDWDYSLKLNPWEMKEKLPTFRDYLKTDCLSLSHSLFKLCELLGYTFGCMPSVTIATTAAKVFDKYYYDLNSIDSNEGFEPYIRKAIYGGRNEVYRRYGENINYYDIKSMYVSCYDVPVPIGKMRWIKPDIDSGTLAEATVKVPKDFYIGPLPVRLGRIPQTLIFPVGEFTGWYDVRELKFAASLGVDVIIRRQLYCEEEPILREFGNFVGKLRGTKEDSFWKLFGLALSGKLGQSRWRDTIKHLTEIKNFEGYSPMDYDETYFTKKEYIKGRAPYIKPAIAMRIRAEARMRHLKALLDAKSRGNIYYCDTDSIFTNQELETGDEVGDLKLLDKADMGYFIRQKLYALVKKGKLRQVSAGYSDLKLSEEDFKHLLQGGTLEGEVEFLSTYRETLKGKELRLISYPRRLRILDTLNTRRPIGYDTEPIRLPFQEGLEPSLGIHNLYHLE